MDFDRSKPIFADAPVSKGTRPTLPYSRLCELKQRIHRGALFFKNYHKSSAWISEVQMDDFTVSYLRLRVECGESSYFAQAFRAMKIGTRFTSQRLAIQVFFGLDLESSCTFLSMNFKVMDDLWRHEALLIHPLVIGSKSS